MHPKLKITHVFVHNLKIIVTFLKNDEPTVFKQIVWETQKLHLSFSSSNGSWVIDQNNILSVLINNSKRAGPTKIVVPFLSFSSNLLPAIHIYLKTMSKVSS